MADMPLCTISNCDNPAYRRGLCQAHRMRLRRYGDAEAGGPLNGGPLRFYQEMALSHEADRCLTWPFGRNANGYAVLNTDNRTVLVSRVLCEAVAGAPPTPDHEAAHSCGKGHLGCVAKRHLRWATRKENDADKDAHGTRPRGEQVTGAKLTTSDVRNIRRLKGKEFQDCVAARYGVSQSAISAIQLGKRWAWLD